MREIIHKKHDHMYVCSFGIFENQNVWRRWWGIKCLSRNRLLIFFQVTLKYYFVLLFLNIISYFFYFEASRGAVAQSVTVKPTGCGFDPHSRRWNIYLNLFPFLRSDVKANRGVESCHSTRNASRIRQKVETECLNTRFPLPTLLYSGYSVKLIYFDSII